MRSGTCPKCKATDVRTTTVIHTAMVPSAREFDLYVCAACGYFEHYVADPAKLSAAAAKWPSVSP